MASPDFLTDYNAAIANQAKAPAVTSPSSSEPDFLTDYNAAVANSQNPVQPQTLGNPNLPFGGQRTSASLPPLLAGAEKNLLDLPYNAALGGAWLADKGTAVAGKLTGIPGTNAQQQVKGFFSPMYQYWNQMASKDPIAATIGGIGGDILGMAPSMAVGVPEYQGMKEAATAMAPMMVANAATTYLQSDPNASQASKLTGGALSGVGSGLGVGAIDKISDLFRGGKLAFRNADEVAQTAVKNATTALGGNAENVTPQVAFKYLDKLKDQQGKVSDRLYQARNEAAGDMTIPLDHQGTNVRFYDKDGNKLPEPIYTPPIVSNLANKIQDLQSTIFRSTTPAAAEALEYAKGMQGVDKTPLSFTEAHVALSSIRKAANTANVAKQYDLAQHLGDIGRAFEADINNAVNRTVNQPEVQALHDAAQTHYHDVYAPLRSANASQILEDNLTNEKFTSALKPILNSRPIMNAMGQNGRNVMAAANLNAAKEASINPLSDKMDVNKYANNIASTLKKYPHLYNEVVPHMGALRDALMASQELNKTNAGLSQHSLGQKVLVGAGLTGSGAAGTMAGGPAGGLAATAASYFLPKTKFLFAAGRMLRNPDSRALLKRSADLPSNIAPAIKQAYNKQILTRFNRIAATMPGRALGASVSAPNSDEESNIPAQ